MKYFTPELYVRGQSPDEGVVNAVECLWDEASERYVAYLNTVRDELPPGLRHIDESFYLHDARIRGMGQEAGKFVIVLQLDTPPHSLLTLTFDLVDGPVIEREVLPRENCTSDAAVSWMYDEWERLSQDPPIWLMSVLLSNGWELRLPIRDVQVQEIRAILPAPCSRTTNGTPARIGQTAS